MYLHLIHQFSNLFDYGIFFLKGHLLTCGLNSLISSVYFRSLESVRNWIMEWHHGILSILSNDMFIKQHLMQRLASSLALQLIQAIYSTSMSIFFSFAAVKWRHWMRPSLISMISCSVILLGRLDFSWERKMSLRSEDKITSDMGWCCNFLRDLFPGFYTSSSSLDTSFIPWHLTVESVFHPGLISLEKQVELSGIGLVIKFCQWFETKLLRSKFFPRFWDFSTSKSNF